MKRPAKQKSKAVVRAWLAEPMTPDVSDAIDRLRRLHDVAHIAVLPDVHLADKVCNGVALATTSTLYPQAVGGDIGCGYAAVALDVDHAKLDEPAAGTLLTELGAAVPIHRRAVPLDCPWLDAACATAGDGGPSRLLQKEARHELGTLGRGNHFIEVQAARDDGRLWLMVHSGSRCVGQAVLRLAIDRAAGTRFSLAYLHADSTEGRAYLTASAIARGFAAQNRLAILRAACALLGEALSARADWATLMHRDHNHLMRERHGKHLYWVHRKGAARARPNEPALIPGSMAAPTYHALGRGCGDSLTSCSHGAGRSLPRGKAREAISVESLRDQMRGIWFDDRIAGSLRDEAPRAYRDVERVIRKQRELVRVVRVLDPVLSFKGG